jgi:uncharacterized protein YdeI (YjbR/CyaY-like superfamily)
VVSGDLPELHVESRAQWREWLAANHGASRGVWVTVDKKGSGGRHVSYDDLVDEAIAFGWVDSRPRRLDDRRSQLLMTPRSPRSSWSRVNKQRVERLTAAGLMHPAGQAAVDLARQTGTWTALDEVEELTEPDDLRTALDASPAARRFWNAFPRSTKRAILEWIAAAKRPETRARRIEETVGQAAQDVRANQPRQPQQSRRPGG